MGSRMVWEVGAVAGVALCSSWTRVVDTPVVVHVAVRRAENSGSSADAVP